ncbi:MAG: 4'-phosphopantetheinyl transferase superfamily protein [Kiritimatiellia bacterium]
MSLERSEGVLCLIGAESLSALDTAMVRIQNFIERSSGLNLIDVVYTATKDARGKKCVAGMWVASLEEMAARLTFALNALRSGRTRLRDKSGVFFTTHPIALNGGKIAFIFPGTGSFHLEMMRDLALTFDGVRQRFDDMEEAFSGFCDIASPSEWLFSTSPEHTLPIGESQLFLPLLASASTYLASKVFADFLSSVGVHPDAVGGVGLGAFTAFHATHHDPKLRLVQILRDAGRMLLRLAANGVKKSWIQLTVSGIQSDSLCELALRDPARVIICQRLASDECILAVAPEKQAEVEIAIHNGGGLSVAEPLPAPFNTGLGDSKMRQLLEQFFSKWVNCEPQIPFYSRAVKGKFMGHSTSSVVDGLVGQMIEPLDFENMIGRMYEDGCRIFIEVGARGLLTPIMEKILKERPDPVAVIPMHILHRSGGMQVGQAVGLLAAQGVDIDYSGLRFFAHARRLDFDEAVAEENGEALVLRLTRELPAVRPELVDPRIIFEEDTISEPLAPMADHSHSVTSHSLPDVGTRCPFLRDSEELARTESSLLLRCVLRIEDFPYLNDYAIGTSSVSLSNPQMRGLTLFSVPTGLELMAEAVYRLIPNLAFQRIEHLRSQRWLSFDLGKLTVRLSVIAEEPNCSGQRIVRVRILEDHPEMLHPIMDAQYLLGTTIPEPPKINELPLVGPRLVDWSTKDIYPARLFQGPLLRNVRKVSGWGYNGIDYEVRIPTRSLLIRSVREPLFCIMPLLLDAVVSGFPLWRSHERFHGAISLPFRCRSIRYYAAWVREGTRLKVSLRLVNVTPRSHQVDIIVTDQTGHLILQIKEWEEISGRAKRELHNFVMNPAKYFITQPFPASLLPDTQAEVIGSIYSNETPDFFVSNQELWLKALAAAVLTPNERKDFLEMGGIASRKLEWLLGRVVAKESVRRALLHKYNFCAASADIDIWKDDLGKPHPLGEWQEQATMPLDLSIAHTASLVVGAVVNQGHIGIDVEHVGRDLTEDFLRGVFTIEEQELATKSGDGPTAVLRFWCAKEALSKALGTGIRFAPTDLRIRSSSPATGMLEMELMGAWAENFPNYRQTLIPVKTSILYNHAIAVCLLP